MSVHEGGQVREERLSLIGTLLSMLLRLLIWGAMAAVVSVVVEWICIYFGVWDLPGAQHSQQMLNTERQYLYHAIMAVPLIVDKHAFLTHTLNVATIDAASALGVLNQYAAGLMEYGLAAVNILMVFAARVAVLTLSIPAFVFIGLVGIVRGLVDRDLRKWGGGRETSGTYHLALRFLPDVTVGLWALYLAMPFSINPFYIVGPVVILFAFVMSQLTYRFKKYV